MRRLFFSTLFCLTASLAHAQTVTPSNVPVSKEIGATGIAATEARLSTLDNPDPETLFALSSLRFLRGIEAALQLRWQTDLQADWSELPILRLPIPINPDARPIAGKDITALLDGLVADMDAARDALGRLGAKDFGLEIDVADLWFDINMNSRRDEGEGIVDVAGISLGIWGVSTPEPGQLVIRFDGADAAWLSAYTHLLSGLAEVALGYDPAPSVDQIAASSKAMHDLWGETPPSNAWDMMFGRQVDRVAVILQALSQKPDPEHGARALAHFESMIAENTRFWTLLEAETDNDREWVPNERQTSALGITLPPGTGERWQAVLADAGRLLKGELLMPHWRFGAEAGIDLRAIFLDPPPLDLVGVVQGQGLLPYAKKGPLISAQSWNEFERMIGGDAVMFAVFLN